MQPFFVSSVYFFSILGYNKYVRKNIGGVGVKSYEEHDDDVAIAATELQPILYGLMSRYGKNVVIEAVMHVLDYQDVTDWIDDNK